MIDWSINSAELITIGVLIIGLVAWAIRLEGRVTNNSKDLQSAEAKILAADTLIAKHREQLKEFQLIVTKEYMTTATLHDFKSDMFSELQRMEKRIEAQVDRLIVAKKG